MSDFILSRLHSFHWPQRQKLKIYPVFLPWLGCKGRCIFCAQDIQTGMAQPASEAEVINLLATVEQDLARRKERCVSPPQFAFYGGTFTSIPENIWHICLDFVSRLTAKHLITGFRCSTRPDCLDQRRLQDMKDCGCELVELGVQSFDSHVLAAAGRCYGRVDAIRACRMLSEAGLGPGIQLLPGLPDSTHQGFIADVKMALACNAVCLRFYPCLVLAGSGLAHLWHRGRFRPWELHATIESLAQGWLMAWQAGVPVIRIGLAPQPGLSDAILAGPCHDSIGSRVMGLAFLQIVQNSLTGKPGASPWRMLAPESIRGFLLGWRGELASEWGALGPCEIAYWCRPDLEITW